MSESRPDVSRTVALVSAVLLCVFLLPENANGRALDAHPRSTPCVGSTTADAGEGSFIGQANASCSTGQAGTSPVLTGAEPVFKTIDCGPPQVAGHLRPIAGQYCAYLANICAAPSPAQLPPDPTLTTQVTLRQNADNTWTQVGYSCAVKAATPQATALMARQEIEKLVPHPEVGVAPPGGTSLVNIQTLLWVDTPADRPLGTVSLLGHRVDLQVHVHHVTWDFGDGTTDTTDNPEPRYDPADGCHTVTCPGYWGHTYSATGSHTVTAAVSWTGRYRVDDGTWQDIAGTVTGPTGRATLTIRQARGVLVNDPGR